MLFDRKTKRTILLDLDGTLVDSALSVLDSLQFALHENGFFIGPVLKRTLIGPPIDDILKSLLPEASEKSLRRVKSSFFKVYDEKNCVNCSVYEGSFEFLEKMKSLDKDVYLVTNKRERPTKEILLKHGLNRYFKKIYSINSFPEQSISSKSDLLSHIKSKENLDYSEAIYIGDTAGDYLSCNENKLDFIFAEWGYGSSFTLDCIKAPNFYSI